ncbi:uncharacterized protein LOC142246836 [Anomaloglossus baeobatrachus]|uniref:uncharacterized protein LOC142246836 n=1 Tax=Anomaloglossus baeobatrachus TaxID=238106 RepID=UPI003F4FA02A
MSTPSEQPEAPEPAPGTSAWLEVQTKRLCRRSQAEMRRLMDQWMAEVEKLVTVTRLYEVEAILAERSVEGSDFSSAMEEEDLRRKIRDFNFDKCKRGNQGFHRILLQLFGYLGHGKSSFINTAMCVWSNSDYTNHANAANADEGHTTERLTYQLTKTIVLVDNRGCAKMNTYETGEIFAQLANLLPLDKPVRWSKGFELVDRIVEAEPLVKATDFIVPIFVYSVINSPTPELKEELKEMFNIARELTKVVPTVVLTHRNHENYTEVESMFRDIGVDKFFGLENYTEENSKKRRETHGAVMQFLYEVISDANFRATYDRDADQEMIDRKIFVLNYIHKREIKFLETNLARQKDVENVRMEQAFRLWKQEQEEQMEKQRQQHKERMARLQGEFERQRLRDQHEHEQRMKQREKDKGKKNGKRHGMGGQW